MFNCRLTALTTAVQSVVDPCNIAVYLHSQKLYLLSISRASCNNNQYCSMICVECIIVGISRFSTAGSHRPLLVALPGSEGVLQYGVHDSADAKGRLDDVGNNLLHCGRHTAPRPGQSHSDHLTPGRLSHLQLRWSHQPIKFKSET